MEGYIKKIQNSIEKANFQINDISKLKGSRFTQSFSLNGKGVINKIAADVRGNINDNLTIIIDGVESSALPIGFEGIYDNIQLGYVFILETPIPFTKSFTIRTRTSNSICSVIYTLE